MVETGQGSARADGDLIGDLGKQRGEVYIALHSERSVRLDQSAQSSGIRIGIQTASLFGMISVPQIPNQFSCA